jgi:hypothetical protein
MIVQVIVMEGRRNDYNEFVVNMRQIPNIGETIEIPESEHDMESDSFEIMDVTWTPVDENKDAYIRTQMQLG